MPDNNLVEAEKTVAGEWTIAPVRDLLSKMDSTISCLAVL